jgi:hypothetical protein
MNFAAVLQKCLMSMSLTFYLFALLRAVENSLFSISSGMLSVLNTLQKISA